LARATIIGIDDDEPHALRDPTPPTMNTTSGAGRSRISTEGWTLESLVMLSENFHPIERVKATGPHEDIQRAIIQYEEEGIPMIIEGWQEHEKWPKDLFTLDFFREHTPGGESSQHPLADVLAYMCRHDSCEEHA
jgi:hypothetical protein